MSEPPQPVPSGDATERKRRLAAVFGDVLPDGTADDRPESWGDRQGGSADEWYRGEVPPHHG